MSAIKAHLRRMLAEQKLTATDVCDVLLPDAEKLLPRRASEDARALLDVFLDDQVAMDGVAGFRLYRFLESRGYPVPPQRPTEPSPELRSAALRGNVTETDDVFATLSTLLHRDTETAVVAVLDNEFDLAHPAVASRISENVNEIAGSTVDNDQNGLAGDRLGYDFTRGVADVSAPAYPHGTHVLALATMGTEQVKAVPLKVFDGDRFDAQKCADAIDYAVSRGAKVINMSLMTTLAEEVGPLEQAIRRHPEVLFVLGAGNVRGEIGSGVYDPKTYLGARTLENMVLVTATLRGDGAPDGRYPIGDRFIDLVAPAARLSAIPGGDYRLYSGSSMAAPQVTSIAGKCLALDPTLSPRALRELLNRTSDVSEQWDHLVAAGGNVNSDRALQAAAVRVLVNGKPPLTLDDAMDKVGLHEGERARVARVVAELGE